MHRITYWLDDDGACVQVAVACLDEAWEPWGELTRPYDRLRDTGDQVAALIDEHHSLGAWRAHQAELFQ